VLAGHDEQVAAVVIDDTVQLRALRQIHEAVQHRGLIIARDAVHDAVHRVRHVGVALVVDGHVVGEELRRRRRAEHGAQVDHREALARGQVVDAELRLPWSIAAERGTVGVGNEQPIARLVGLDADGRHEIGVANERHDAAVALDDEDRAFGERARQEAAVRLVVLDAFGNEAAAFDGDDLAPRRGRRRRRRFGRWRLGLGRTARCKDGASREHKGNIGTHCDTSPEVRIAKS
jgi:hypothetical protein